MRASLHRFDLATGWDSPPTAADGDTSLAVLFASPSVPTDLVAEVAGSLGHRAVIGCSTAGEIHQISVVDDSIVVGILDFDATTVRSAEARLTGPADSREAGREVAMRLADPSLRAVLVLSDGLNVNGSELTKGFAEVLGPDVVVTGGLAGDGEAFERTWVLAKGRCEAEFVSAVGLYGDRVRVGHGSQGGWDIFGPERTVTRSEGNLLYELDGRPALALYKEYLGEHAQGLPATGLLFPLSIHAPGDDKRLTRTILAVDEDAQALVFAGDVPEGHRAQLMQANFDRLVGGAESAGRDARRRGGDDALVSIAISCVGRRLVLGDRTEEEVEATLDTLPPGTVQLGFYSYGEISPHTDGTCDLHNQTMTLTTIGEN